MSTKTYKQICDGNECLIETYAEGKAFHINCSSRQMHSPMVMVVRCELSVEDAMSLKGQLDEFIKSTEAD